MKCEWRWHMSPPRKSFMSCCMIPPLLFYLYHKTDMPQRGAASTAWARNEDAGVEVDFWTCYVRPRCCRVLRFGDSLLLAARLSLNWLIMKVAVKITFRIQQGTLKTSSVMNFLWFGTFISDRFFLLILCGPSRFFGGVRTKTSVLWS